MKSNVKRILNSLNCGATTIKLAADDVLVLPLLKANNLAVHPACKDLVKRIFGFTGNCGTLFITSTRVVFCTNGIYRLQAELEMPDARVVSKVTAVQWLTQNGPFKRFFYDPKWWTCAEFKPYERHFETTRCLAVPITVGDNTATQGAIVDYDEALAGESSASKVARVAAAMDSDYLLLGAADSIAWLLNLRGNDVENYRLFFGYALLARDSTVELFTDATYDDPRVRPISELSDVLQGLSDKTVSYDARFTGLHLKQALQSGRASADPCQALKAIKNPVEIEGFKDAHTRDAAAMMKFLYWFYQEREVPISERDCVDMLNKLRSEQQGFVCNSFDPIVAFNANAAVVHYNPCAQPRDTMITGDGVLLVDSGGHYVGGTTDVTRTLAVGTPTAKMKRCYTMVLKGHLALQRACFPVGTTFKALDCIARLPLWERKADYSHGTGHGVGHSSAVHEYPGFSSDVVIEEGMIVTIEPGYYVDNAFGIRIENVVLVVRKGKGKKKGTGFLKFEPLTMVPYDMHLIDESMLSLDEYECLKSYYAKGSRRESEFIIEMALDEDE
jgi:Xaa-Pro aminopeptidase